MPSKYYLIIFVALLFSANSFAQEMFELLNHTGTIKPEIFISTDKEIGINTILTPEYQSKFAPIKHKTPIVPNKIYWYKIDFSTIDLKATDLWLLRFINYNQIRLFYIDNDSIISTDKGKNYHSDSEFRVVDFEFHKSNLIEKRFLYARIINNKRSFTLGLAAYLNPFAAKINSLFYSKSDFLQQIVYILFIGGMLLISAYFFGIYFIFKDKLFIIYGFYLFSILLYLGAKASFIELPAHNLLSFYFTFFHELIQVLVNIFYLIFASHFLKARTDFPKLHTAIRYMVKILLGIMAVQVLLMSTENYYYIEEYVMKFERYFVITFSFWAYYYIIRNYKDPLVFFLLAGSFIYIIGGLSALIFKEVAYMMFGAAIEVFFFSLGMGYRMKKIEKEKNAIENEITRIELSALKAQMNPHFIFNSLNSIRAYVISNKVKEASDYITKFARLIRIMLQYSAKEFVSLQEDIESLQLYIQLEELRFREDFGLEISINEKIDPELLLIPPLILQPYVENAILHGLVPKSGTKKLQLSVYSEKNYTVFKISDNGVGRQYSEKIKTPSDGHKSMAMELTKKRINLAWKYAPDESIVINDLTENGLAAGTEVVLKLPLNSFTNNQENEIENWNN